MCSDLEKALKVKNYDGTGKKKAIDPVNIEIEAEPFCMHRFTDVQNLKADYFPIKNIKRITLTVHTCCR